MLSELFIIMAKLNVHLDTTKSEASPDGVEVHRCSSGGETQKEGLEKVW